MSAPSAAAESYILCELAGTTYGVPSRDVQQVEMVEQITPVPNTPPFVEGVVFVRGQVIPALSLRRRFGLAPRPHDLRSRLIVVHLRGRTVGLLVDSAREFRAIPPDALQPPPEGAGAPHGGYLEGIAALGERLVLILRVEELLGGEALPAALLDPPAS